MQKEPEEDVDFGSEAKNLGIDTRWLFQTIPNRKIARSNREEPIWVFTPNDRVPLGVDRGSVHQNH